MMKINGFFIGDRITQEYKSGRSVVISVSKTHPLTLFQYLYFETFFFKKENNIDFYMSMWNEFPGHPLIYSFLNKYAVLLHSGIDFKEAKRKVI